jgi:purine-binding chemotaxis protein CheW
MSKSLTASKKVMKTYLSELLTETEVAEDLPQQRFDKKTLSNPVTYKENRSLEKLLKTVSEPNEELARKEVNEAGLAEIDLLPITTEKSRDQFAVIKEKSYRQGDFQAMFFDVAGLTIAVPLIELGGIHKVDKTTSLMGKPDWFKGVMLYRDEKINVVDTALWVMPEKCDETLKKSLNYQYVIMLNDSPWGLMAEHLVDTVVLSQDEVKWLDSTNKRPWLAGLVKEKMCALLDVSALIKLLDKGSDIYQEQ